MEHYEVYWKSIRKIDWECGAAESISFLILFPLIIMVYMSLVGYSDYAIMRQSFEFTNYMAARAASVSATQDMAQEKADAAFDKYLRNNRATTPYVKNGKEVKTEINVVVLDEATDNLTVVKNRWSKGGFFSITSYINYDPVVPFYNSRAYQTTLVLMIENGALSIN